MLLDILSYINTAMSNMKLCFYEICEVYIVKFKLSVLCDLINKCKVTEDHVCGLVVRVLGYGSGGPGSIPDTTRKNSGSGTGPTQPREYN
jgi:hypothetical protein